MSSTDFKPSVHGWPFDNFGNCRSMCFSVPDRFSARKAIDRSTPKPKPGDAPRP